ATVLTADKNTVEADQESSAVLGVCQAFRATGDQAWLRKNIGGVPVVDRADRALGFLLAKRFDARLGLVTSGFSADWGDVSPVYATGGNGTAILSGIADDRRARRILAVADERRRRFAVSTIAGTLLPPYAAGLFAHPVMREPWTYQNGGQWDWFGARLVLAAFQRGQSDRARRWLAELAQKAGRSGGLYEWHTRDGQGRGSPTYAGSAGALAAAVFEGLFGVSLSADELRLTVRLGPKPGRIHLYQPATDTFVAYRYEPSDRTLALDYDSNHGQTGHVAVL